MRFMVMCMAPQEAEAGPPPTPEAFAAMQKYNEELVKAGVLLAAEGLAPLSQGARVKFSGDERIVIDGPFTEAKELVAGFTIIQVKSKEEAIAWVRRAPNVSPNGESWVEIRKLMDVEDFGDMMGDAFTPNEEIAKVKY
ncbi:MAG TPA: YciI family protein [Longimicrobium sp.]|nr:YciI family protein [Longimicrobium sp.]